MWPRKSDKKKVKRQIDIKCYSCGKIFSFTALLDPYSIPNDILPKAEVFCVYCPYCGKLIEIRFLFNENNEMIKPT